MKIGEDGFITVSANAQVKEVIQALDQVAGEGYPRPRFAVAQKKDGSIAGIILTTNLDWAEPDESVSNQADLHIKREQVDLKASEAEKKAAIEASNGLALGILNGRPVAILRPAELGIDGRLPLGKSGLAAEPGSARCPNCNLAISQYLSLPRLQENKKVVFERYCPHCNWLISER